MTTHAAIGVDDNFATGQTGVTHWSTNNKTTGWVDVNFGFIINQFSRDGGFDDMFDDVCANSFVAQLNAFKLIGVLAGNNDGMNSNRFSEVILNGNLAFAIRVHPLERAVFAGFCHAAGQLVGIVDRHWHQGFGFVTSVAKHHALVTGTTGGNIFFAICKTLGFSTAVNTHGNIAGLVGKSGQNATGCTVEAFFATIVADAVDNFAHQRVDIDISLGCYFAVG